MNSRNLILTAASSLFCFSVHAQTVLYWDSDQNFSNGTGGGGVTAAWNTNALRWYNGTANVAWSDGSVAVFAGDTNGNPNISGSTFNPVAHSLVFSNVSGYLITSAAAPRLTVTSGNIYAYTDAAIDARITNAVGNITTGIRKLGPAKLALTGNNPLLGGIFVLKGTLVLTNKQAIGGASQPLTINGGNLELSLTSNVSDRVLYIGDDGATINLPTETDSWLFQQNQGTNGTLTKTGAGVFNLGNNNNGGMNIHVSTRTGATIIEEGTLGTYTAVGSALGTGPVTVKTNGTLAGPGLIGGPVTVQGIISPLGSIEPLSLPNMTLANGLDMSAGGTYLWQLAALKDDGDGVAGTDFDRISITNGTLTLGGSSKLSINFTGSATAPDVAEPFWQANHTWTVIALSDTASNPSSGNIASLQNASYAAGTFSTSVNPSGNILLTFTTAAAPAPHIETIVNEGMTNVVLTWTSVSNRNYQVEFNTNLNTTNWVALTNVTASSVTTSVADPAGADPQRYYRVALLP